MKYAILLLLAIISMASMLTFRSRNRVHVHEIDCPEAQALDDKYMLKLMMFALLELIIGQGSWESDGMMSTLASVLLMNWGLRV